MSFRARNSRSKILLTLGAGIFLFSILVSSLFPSRAYAILGAGDTSIDITPPFTPNQQQYLHTSEKVELSVKEAILASTLSAAVQGARYFMTKIAYDTAQYVANGGKGQASMLFSSNWYNYLGQVGGDALGAAVQDLGASWGFDFCSFPNIDLQLYIQLGLRQMAAPHTDCTWNDLKAAYGKDAWVKRYENVKDTADRFGTSDKILKEFSKSIKPANTDFGIGVGALVQVDRMKVQREKSAEAERSTNKGFKDLQSLISGNVMTPGEVIGEETKAQLSQVKQGERQEISLAGIYASGAYQIIPETAAMFLNTMGSTLLQRLFSDGLVPSGDDSYLAYDYGSDPAVLNNIEEAKNAYNFLYARTPSQPTSYNVVDHFAACPDNPGLDNCVIDRGLQELLSRAALGQPLTIGEAIKPENGAYLNPNWPLISPRRLQENQNIKGCVSEKYCYSNIQKLRKARILPLGFEIAALRSDPDKPWTLGEVVAGFYDCRYDPNDPTRVIPDPAKPFCHLINPNWVIKSPPSRCEIEVYSDGLIDPASSARREECADVSTCLAKDDTGACAQYGYCTKESNTWRVVGPGSGDACPSYYSTCTTYVNTENKKITSYLAKTVDYGECTADNTGCRAYSFVATSNPDATTTTWINTNDIDLGQNQVIFFNKKIQDQSAICNANNNGCSAFYGASRLEDGRFVDSNTSTPAIDFVLNTSNRLNIKKAPVYMGCYDGNKQQAGTQRPTTIFEAEAAGATAAACNQFATACVAEEVGCEAFTPINSATGNVDGPSVPGKIGDGNFCAAACVGYETFKQEKTAFDKAKFPMHFIPSQAQECPAIASGCSEFTNIDAQAQGGEGLEYYTDLKYCEKPSADNVKTFYSWEGTANNGFVLLTYQLKPLTQADQNAINRPGFVAGSPAYNFDTRSALDEFTSKCSEEKYNKLLADPTDPDAADPDCRAIFDSNGATYYRLLKQTVTVDPACHPLRKTEAVFEVDPDIATQLACDNKAGKWANNVCERCINGGKFQNGFCVYQTISKLGESNACAPEYNGCRAYSGNAAGNIRDVFPGGFDDFEPTAENEDAFLSALGSWIRSATSSIRVVGEATHTQFHSLEIPGNTMQATRSLQPFDVEENSWYELSFLGKSGGAVTSLLVGFKVGDQYVGQFAPPGNWVDLPNTWQRYTLGPIQFTGKTGDTVTLVFERPRAGNNSVYIDQVQLRRITDFKHYIKDSWKKAEGNNGFNVPLACDSAPEDNLPGEALGCRQYNDSAGNPRYATGFQSLCREKAIGCQPVWDTFNTVNGGDATQAQVFNVECFGQANSTCTIKYENRDIGTCFIPQGKGMCYVPQMTLPAGITMDRLQQLNQQQNNGRLIRLGPSGVIIPADTPSSSPLFLALGEKEKHTCPAGAVGCRKVGQEQRILPNTEDTSYQFKEMFVKNDPEIYKDTLCRSDLVGCSEYTHDNKTTYFKDPEITGNSLCVYKGQQDGVSSQYGWFLKDIGRCTETFNVAGRGNVQQVGDRLCKTDGECGGSERCVEKETVACSEDNLRVGGFFDIWSNKAPQYDGNVGVCTSENNKCTELIDRQDTSNLNPEGKPYYVIYNDKMIQKEKACTQVSLADGCVLFDKTDEPNKLFDSRATYLRSEKKPGQPFGAVEAVRSTDSLEFRVADTNKILKVDRDRECSEWLACKSYATTIDYSGGARKETQICSQLAACDKIGVGGTCANWVDPRRPGTDAAALALSRLTYDKYITRGVSWYNSEFSGYSLYNKYQIGDLIYVKFSFPEDIQPFMENEMNQTYIVRQLRQSVIDSVDGQAFDCKPAAANPNTDWQRCGFGDNQVGGGRCYSNRCMYPINGSFPTNINIDLNDQDKNGTALLLKQLIAPLEPNSCKGTPEPDSPYSDKILKVGVGEPILKSTDVPGERRNTTVKLEGFSAANACQFGACSCAYQKVIYKSGNIDYWPLIGLKPGTIIPEGVCVGGGKKENFPCTESIDCVDNNGTTATEDDEFGSCALRQNVETRIGLEGYCLEDDLSRPIFYNGQNSFACLTWLPVNISASSVDIYNRDVSAGYNLRDDAPNGGGQVFCSESTKAGAGIYDPEWMTLRAQPGSSVADQMNSLYFQYFNDDGSPRLDGVMPNGGYWKNLYNNYSCDGGLRQADITPNDGQQNPVNLGVPPYISTICAAHDDEQNQDNAKVLTTALYSWLYKQNVGNATLLRVEWGAPHGAEDNWGNDWDPGEGPNERPARRLYSLAPVNAGVETDDNIKEFGTIMHMPRTFGTRGTLSESDTWLTQSDLINPPENMGRDTSAKVHVGGYGLLDESGIRGGRVYRSNFERYMREDDLSKVHFLPLSFPAHANSEVPTLMEKFYVIDFDRLRLPGQPAADAFLMLDSAADDSYFSGPKANRDTVLWTYRLENISQSAFAFNDYSLFHQSNAVQSLTTGELGERNRIHTRYVAVWSDWIAHGDNDETPNFLQQHVPIDQAEGVPGIIRENVSPATPNSDPFSAPCVASHGNWHAVGMDFNKDGEFLGYISRFCQYAGGEDDVGIQFAVAAVVHDRCATFDQVYRSDGVQLLSETTNKAWTNRVWAGAVETNNNTNVSVRKLANQNPWNKFLRDTRPAPYASTNLVEYELSNFQQLRNYTFRYKDQGLPYICSIPWLGGRAIDDTKRCQAMLLIPLDSVFVGEMNAVNNIPDAKGKIDGLFAKIWKTVSINQDYTQGRGLGIASDLREVDGRDTGNTHVAPPKIFSLNPARCQERDKCTVAESENITVGGRNGTLIDYNQDNIPDEPDVDANGIADPIIVPGGAYTAEAKFFAFADDNHMPLRRVMVDWDEEGLAPINADKRGLYKNRKPICGTSNQGGFADVGLCANGNSPTGATCSLEKPCPGNETCVDPSRLKTGALGDAYRTIQFGNTPRACVDDHFIFVHQYSCGPSNIGTKNDVLVRDLASANNPYFSANNSEFTPGIISALKQTYGLQDDDYVCVFKPRVQVQDNWGWCSGRCTADYNGVRPNQNGALRNGCYNEQPTDIAGSTDKQCDAIQSPPGLNPWSPYRGSIIVIPLPDIQE